MVARNEVKKNDINRMKILFIALLITAVMIFVVAGALYFQQYSILRCEACGMNITPEMQQHIRIQDANGNRHYACCQACMLRLLDQKRGHEQLTIETFCDYYGPDYKITINAKKHGNLTTVTPDTARILLGAKVVPSCANNRIAWNQTAVEGLLGQGYTSYTMGYQQNPLPPGTPVESIDKLAVMMAQKGISYVAPTPLMPTLLAVVGVVMIAGSFMAYRKMPS